MRRVLIILALAAVALSGNARLLKRSKPVPQPVVADEPTIVYKPVTDILGGEWTIKAVGSTTIDREENAPYIYFVPEEDAFYASNGCNVLNGIFTVEDGYIITFHSVLATMRYCTDTPFDTQINDVLRDERTVMARYENVAGEGFLYLNDKSGRRLITLRRHALAFLNGNWRVTEINGKAFDGDEMTIFFDIDERKVHGNTGCNYFNGDIYIDPVESNAISLSNMGVTQRMCANIDRERSLLVALEETTTVIDGQNGTALLTDKTGRSAVKLEKIVVTPEADTEE